MNKKAAFFLNAAFSIPVKFSQIWLRAQNQKVK